MGLPYCLLGAVDRSPAPSVGPGIEEPEAHSGGGFGAPVALCVGLWVVLGQAAAPAVVVGALLQSRTGRRRWHSFAFRLGRDG